MQFTIQEDLNSIKIMVSAAVIEEQVPSVLEKVRAEFIHVQKNLHVQLVKKKFEYKQANRILYWKKAIEQSVFILDAQKTYNLDVFSKNYLKDVFSIDSITSLTEEEIQQIQQGENDWYPTRFHPLRYQTYAKNSVILRHENEVIGWCVVVPTTSELLMYDNLFVKAEYQSFGRALSLFYHALSIQITQSPIRYITFTVHGDNDPMLKLLRKRVADVLIDYQNVVIYQLDKQIENIETEYQVPAEYRN